MGACLIKSALCLCSCYACSADLPIRRRIQRRISSSWQLWHLELPYLGSRLFPSRPLSAETPFGRSHREQACSCKCMRRSIHYKHRCHRAQVYTDLRPTLSTRNIPRRMTKKLMIAVEMVIVKGLMVPRDLTNNAPYTEANFPSQQIPKVSNGSKVHTIWPVACKKKLHPMTISDRFALGPRLNMSKKLPFSCSCWIPLTMIMNSASISSSVNLPTRSLVNAARACSSLSFITSQRGD